MTPDTKAAEQFLLEKHPVLTEVFKHGCLEGILTEFAAQELAKKEQELAKEAQLFAEWVERGPHGYFHTSCIGDVYRWETFESGPELTTAELYQLYKEGNK